MEAVVSLANRLKMIVVAEGVETMEQYKILSDMNCQLGQGYLFSKPLPKEKVTALIETIERNSQQDPEHHYSLINFLPN